LRIERRAETADGQEEEEEEEGEGRR